MDHSEAIKLRAAERYALGELPEQVRDAYEEHFFDCVDCAMDMKAVSAFVDGARDTFAEDARSVERDPATETVSAKPSRDSEAGWWKSWWQPLIAVPAFAVLLFVVALGVWRVKPGTQNRAVAGQTTVAETFQPKVRLLGDARGGQSALPKVSVRADESFALDFDFTPSGKYDAYIGELRDDAGHVVLPVTLSGDMANREVRVLVPGGIARAGNYTLVFAAGSSRAETGFKTQPVQSFAFTVEIVR
jgi:hypothetical protein